jgi:stage V sporulation protein G
MSYAKPATVVPPVPTPLPAPAQSEAKSLFSDFRIVMVNKDSLRAIASCKIADALFLNGMRVVEGSKGRFVSMPSRKDKSGEYQDVFFPANREVRQQLQDEILSRYAELATQEAA